jgi:hypothetical protein
MMDIAIAMYKIDPNYYYQCHSGTYDALTMLDGRPKPTLEMLETAWADWLNSEAKTDALKRLEQRAETERMKYITGGDGKAMAYQQQLYEVRKWEAGETNAAMFPVANQLAIKLAVPVFAVLAQWQSNINAWLVVGGKIEANLAKAKAELIVLTVNSLADLDNFVTGINWSA